jgi:hypothetical protein
MEDSSTRLVISTTLMTLGIVLMLLGISWLVFLGLALIMLSGLFPSQKADSRGLVAFMIYAAGALMFLILDLHDGDAFVQETQPLWFRIAMVGTWFWSVISEFRRWRKKGLSP